MLVGSLVFIGKTLLETQQAYAAFQNEQGWVPVYYLFDAEGKLKTRAAGEFGVSVLQTALDKMFAAAAAA